MNHHVEYYSMVNGDTFDILNIHISPEEGFCTVLEHNVSLEEAAEQLRAMADVLIGLAYASDTENPQQ